MTLLRTLLTHRETSARQLEDIRRAYEATCGWSDLKPPPQVGSVLSWSRHLTSRGDSILRKALPLHPLINLGSGTEWNIGECHRDMEPFGVREIIHVERFFKGYVPRADRNIPDRIKIEPQPTIDFRVVCADMLEFLLRVRSGSCNVILDGLTSTMRFGPLYRTAVKEEIARVTAPGGLVLITNSPGFDDLPSSTFRRCAPEEFGGDEFAELCDMQFVFQRK